MPNNLPNSVCVSISLLRNFLIASEYVIQCSPIFVTYDINIALFELAFNKTSGLNRIKKIAICLTKLDFPCLFSKDLVTIFEFSASSIKLYPRFCPFLGQKSVYQVDCVVALYPKNAKMRKSQISEKTDEYGLFDLFLPSCTDSTHLFPYRYDVGWVFIFEVDLFPHTSKGLIFIALPPLRAFSQ